MKYHLSCKVITTPADEQGPGTNFSALTMNLASLSHHPIDRHSVT